MITAERSMLAAARTERGLALTELAKLAGVPLTQLWRVEHGVRDPSPELAAFLVGFFGRDLFPPLPKSKK